MNIFVFSEDPVKCAELLDSKRLVKMVLETAQLLSTALHKNGASHLAPYKKTHENHPCTKWAALNRQNYLWLVDYFIAASDEYTRRYGRIHKCVDYIHLFEMGAEVLPVGERTKFVNCAKNDSKGLDFTHIDDVHLAYQMYMDSRYPTDARPPKW